MNKTGNDSTAYDIDDTMKKYNEEKIGKFTGLMLQTLLSEHRKIFHFGSIKKTNRGMYYTADHLLIKQYE